MLKSSLCEYIDACILVKGAILNAPVPAPAANPNDNSNKQVVFKISASFTDCITKINNTKIDDAKDIDIVMLMYNLIQYTNNCSKTPGILWQYYRDETFLDYNDATADFLVAIITVLSLH